MNIRKFFPGLFAVGLSISTPAFAVPISPLSYDMLNGNTGSWTYHDEIYTGAGNVFGDNAPLTGGLGDLTDGIVAPDNFIVTEPPAGNGPYVGWAINPTIVFRFGAPQLFNSVTLYLDDSNGTGGVSAPSSINVSLDGGPATNYPVAEPPGIAPFFVTLPLGTATDVSISLIRSNAWVFLSEVTFDGQVVNRSVPDGGFTLGLLTFGVGALAILRRVVRRRN